VSFSMCAHIIYMEGTIPKEFLETKRIYIWEREDNIKAVITTYACDKLKRVSF